MLLPCSLNFGSQNSQQNWRRRRRLGCAEDDAEDDAADDDGIALT